MNTLLTMCLTWFLFWNGLWFMDDIKVLSYGKERSVILEALVHDKECVLANILAATFLCSSDEYMSMGSLEDHLFRKYLGAWSPVISLFALLYFPNDLFSFQFCTSCLNEPFNLQYLSVNQMWWPWFRYFSFKQCHQYMSPN